jgi:excisionase family DNA binding protein
VTQINIGVIKVNEVKYDDITKPHKIAYSVEELSNTTSLSKAYLRNEIRAGRLKARRFGRRVLILAEEVEHYLRRNSQA